MGQNHILLVGSANMDLSLNMYKVPEAGETVIDDGGLAYVPGGKGANSAVALARLGAECTFCAKVGADLHGQKLYEFYKSVGLRTEHLYVDHDAPTGLAVVLKEADGANRIIVYPGANGNLNSENVTLSFACQPDALYLGFEIPFPAALTAAKVAASRNIPIFVDAAPASKDYPLGSLPTVEIFSPNESETEIYTGIRPQGLDSCLQAAWTLYRMVKCHYVVIKMGKRGAFCFDGKHNFLIPAFPVKAVDTTAAGDAFTAAMTLEYLRTGDIRQAVRYGAAAGAITVTQPGASSSLPNEEQVRDFLARQTN